MAVKLLPAEVAEDSERRRWFEGEARATAAVVDSSRSPVPAAAEGPKPARDAREPWPQLLGPVRMVYRDAGDRTTRV